MDPSQPDQSDVASSLGARAMKPHAALAWSAAVFLILLVNFALAVAIIFRSMRTETLFVFAAGLIALGLTELILITALKIPIPAAMQYIAVIVSIPFGLQYMLHQKMVIQERDSLRHAYNRDALTGAYNRHALGDVNFVLYASAIFLDLDSFKYYNDRYGHERGDDLLRSFVALSQSLLRKGDIVVRYGGDEFLILLRETIGPAVEGAAERIRAAFRNAADDDRVDVSYGTMAITTDDTLDFEELDRRMYAMKNRRRVMPKGY